MFQRNSHTSELSQAKAVIICSVQHEVFQEDLKSLENRQAWPRQNTLKKLSPVVDKDGLLCFGGHLSSADLAKEEQHPLIIPHAHHISYYL